MNGFGSTFVDIINLYLLWNELKVDCKSFSGYFGIVKYDSVASTIKIAIHWSHIFNFIPIIHKLFIIAFQKRTNVTTYSDEHVGGNLS